MARLDIPPVDEILQRGIAEVIREKKSASLSELVNGSNFANVIEEIEKKAHEVYLKEEVHAVRNKLIREGLSKKDADMASKAFITDNLVTSISNTRRARGGSSSEGILRLVLNSMGIPCEKGRIKDKGYRPDLVIPSNDVISSTPERGVAIAVKRTLRERWSEDIDVFRFPRGMFVLFLPDPDFNMTKAEDMISRGMKEIYINDELYEKSGGFLTKEFHKLSDLPMSLQVYKAPPSRHR